jgi:hypothetical protein
MAEIDFDQAELVIVRLAQIASAFGQQAGVGGMETAGNLISYLAKHPRDIEPCLRFGIMELPLDWHERGSLTWHAMNGKVVHPDYARRARTIRQLEKGPTDDR